VEKYVFLAVVKGKEIKKENILLKLSSATTPELSRLPGS
jgi:hypothetical protein